MATEKVMAALCAAVFSSPALFVFPDFGLTIVPGAAFAFAFWYYGASDSIEAAMAPRGKRLMRRLLALQAHQARLRTSLDALVTSRQAAPSSPALVAAHAPN